MSQKPGKQVLCVLYSEVPPVWSHTELSEASSYQNCVWFYNLEFCVVPFAQICKKLGQRNICREAYGNFWSGLGHQPPSSPSFFLIASAPISIEKQAIDWAYAGIISNMAKLSLDPVSSVYLSRSQQRAGHSSVFHWDRLPCLGLDIQLVGGLIIGSVLTDKIAW